MGKKLLMLLAGYFAGSVVTGLYAEKKGDEVQKEMKKEKLKGGDEKTFFIDYIFNIQKRFFGDVQKKVLTKKNKQFIESKKEEVLDLIAEYKIDAEKMLTEVKGKGKDYLDNAYSHLEEFSKLKAEEGEERIAQLGKKGVAEFQKGFDKMIQSLKSNFK